MTPEFDLLAKSINYFLTKEKVDIPKVSFDDKKLLQLARQHGLAIPLLHCAKAFLPEKTEFLGQLKIHSLNQHLRSKKHHIQLAELSNEFTEAGVQHSLLKGPGITAQLCHNLPSYWRPSVDLDILVCANQMPNAVAVLSAMKYKSAKYKNIGSIADFIAKHDHCVNARDIGFTGFQKSYPIDLHWHAAYHYSLPFDTAELLSGCERININNTQVPVLEFNRHFILVCIHGYQDYFFRLKHLADVFFAMHHPNFNKNEILRVAKCYGVERQVSESLNAAEYFFLDYVDSEKLTKQSKFTQKMMRHFIANNGEASRIQSSKKRWSPMEKWRYIQKQIGMRSQKAKLFSPITSRLKLSLEEIDQQDDVTRKKPLRFRVFQQSLDSKK